MALHEVAAAWLGEGAARGPGADLRLKWPNDLMAGAAKLAGILLERAGDAVVLGFGVNLAHRPEALDRPTASFAALGAAPPDPAAFLDDLATALARRLRGWRQDGLARLRADWLARAHPLGTPLASGGEEGLFDGLDDDGALRLRRGDGAVVRVRAGDVFLL